MYELIFCIQAYFRIERKRNITLADKKGCCFRNLNSALNFQVKQSASAGVGVDVKLAQGRQLFVAAWLFSQFHECKNYVK